MTNDKRQPLLSNKHSYRIKVGVDIIKSIHLEEKLTNNKCKYPSLTKYSDGTSMMWTLSKYIGIITQKQFDSIIIQAEIFAT